MEQAAAHPNPAKAAPTGRSMLFGAAATLIGLGAILGFVSSLLTFVDNIDEERASVIVAESSGLIASSIWVAALAFAVFAFLGDLSSRSRKLWIAFSLAAASLLLEALSDAVTSYFFATTDFIPGTGVAFNVVDTVAVLVAAAAAWIVAIAYLRAESSGFATRDGRLGTASGVAVGVFVLVAASHILQLIFYSDLGVSSALSTGFGIGAGGSFVAAGAFAVAAVGLLRYPGHSERRDLLVGIAASIFAGGYLLVALGDLISATAFSDNGFDGTTIASAWLGTVGSIAICGAGVCAALGLLLWRQGKAAAAL